MIKGVSVSLLILNYHINATAEFQFIFKNTFDQKNLHEVVEASNLRVFAHSVVLP